MSKKDPSKQNRPVEEFEIFGEHKTREQIKAEEKARRKAEHQAMKEALAARNKENKETGKFGAVLSALGITSFATAAVYLVVAVVLVAGTLLVFSHVTSQGERFNRDESQEAYYLDETAMPEMSTEGIMSAVNEIYYTKGGHIAVRMTLSNGTDQHLKLVDISVELKEEDGTLIAGGWAKVQNEVVILTNSTTDYTFYISPKHIKKKVDAFTNLTCDVTAAGKPTVE